MALTFCGNAVRNSVMRPAKKHIIDLSDSTLLECCHEYVKFKRKQKPKFGFSVLKKVKKVENVIGTTLEPNQVTDDFWIAFINWLQIDENLTPSTTRGYCGQLRTCLEWASRHNAVVDPDYDAFEVDSYEPTRVVLNMHQLHTLYDFKFESVTHEVTKKQRVYTYENVIRTTRKHTKINKVCYRHKTYVENGKLVKKKIKCRYTRVVSIKKQVIKKRSVAKYVEVKVVKPVLRPDSIRTFNAVRDLFCLSCCLYQRHSDMVRITPDCFNSDKSAFSTCQQKTGNKAVVNIKQDSMDYKIAKAILEKYDYHCPYTATIGNYNKHLHAMLKFIGGDFVEEIKVEYKRLGEIVTKYVPMYKMVSSHAGRRTAITNSAVTNKVPLINVMRKSGHKDYRSAQKYLVFSDED